MGETGTDHCRVCESTSRTEHRQAEIDGRLRHAWSDDGSLKIAEPPRTDSQRGPRVVVANAVDVQLREALIRKGVLSYDDFAVVPPRDTAD